MTLITRTIKIVAGHVLVELLCPKNNDVYWPSLDICSFDYILPSLNDFVR